MKSSVKSLGIYPWFVENLLLIYQACAALSLFTIAWICWLIEMGHSQVLKLKDILHLNLFISSMFSIILLSNFSGRILDIFIDPNYCDIFLTEFWNTYLCLLILEVFMSHLLCFFFGNLMFMSMSMSTYHKLKIRMMYVCYWSG